MVAAYAQAIKLVGKSNERSDPLSIPYEKANPEAMGYMRVVCQLATILLKFRKEQIQENVLEHERRAVAPAEDSTSDA